VCHSYVTRGHITLLADRTHALATKMLPAAVERTWEKLESREPVFQRSSRRVHAIRERIYPIKKQISKH
jgi:hypothetical protein